MESLLLIEVEVEVGGREKDLGAAGRPLERGSPYPPNLPDPPRTSLHGNRRVGGKNFSRFLNGGCRAGKFLEFGGRCEGFAECGFAPDLWAGRVGNVCLARVEIDPPSSVVNATASTPRGSLLYAVRTWQTAERTEQTKMRTEQTKIREVSRKLQEQTGL